MLYPVVIHRWLVFGCKYQALLVHSSSFSESLVLTCFVSEYRDYSDDAPQSVITVASLSGVLATIVYCKRITLPIFHACIAIVAC